MDNEKIDEGYFNIDESKEILAKCKNCGNKSPAKDFKLGDNINGMVCSDCFKRPNFRRIGITKKIEETLKEEVGEEKPRSIVIYKEDDVFREFSNRKIKEKRIEYEKDPKIKKTCDKCGFGFRYNEKKDWPNKCPGCGKFVKKFGEGRSLLY